MSDQPVGNFGKLAIQNNRNMADFFPRFSVLHGFCVKGIKSQAVFRSWWIGFGRDRHILFKLQVYNPVQLYKFP